MSFFSIIETLLIGPLKLVFEIIFECANRFVGHPGLAIVFLSLIMNILVLPLYRRADIMQEETRDREAKLADGVSHIKKTFSGDERMMILQTYYRQNHYKPTDALNGSVSLLLEIPFFIAAYQFLSHLEILQGVSFGPIRDLGAPDGLLVIGGFAVNLLPILMTLINICSGALYLKGFPMKTKVQLYAMAVFFLVFLYASPACLVFYWTLNNVFSLVKNIFYKLKDPQKVLRILCAVIGGALFLFGAVFYAGSVKRKVFLAAIGLLLMLPMALSLQKRKKPAGKEPEPQPDRTLFLLGTVFLTVLIGLLIPSVFIAASPQEYVDITYFHNPLWYIVRSFCLSIGVFLIWMRVFYWIASKKGKVYFERFVWVFCAVAVINYMFFGTNLGVISSVLQYENGMTFSFEQQAVNLFVLAGAAFLCYQLAVRFKRAVTLVLAASMVALIGMSALNLHTIRRSVSEISAESQAEAPSFQLSRTGKNVVVIMLDRAMGEYIPYIFGEKPELKEQFSGFTYYANTISFGGYTNFGIPALMGGYEYTPVELNKRKSEPLVAKHDEALKVMPTLFSQNGYRVTVCDPTYAGYRWIPDLSIYADNPDIRTFITGKWFGNKEQKQQVIENNDRNFFCFGMMKSLPVFLQPEIYDNGQYHRIISSSEEETLYSTQVRKGVSVSDGLSESFMNAYGVLENMSTMTQVTEEPENTFLFLSNDATHEPMLLQEPEYTPAAHVDNTAYDEANASRFLRDGERLKVENDEQMIHYHANMAALLKLGEWFDSLKEQGVYDNTRIILTADHGRFLAQSDQLIMAPGDHQKDVEFYYPLLMVKDFDSDGFVTSEAFMTNADVPALATEGLISHPVNPFTGKEINSSEKTAHDQFVILSDQWGVSTNNGNTYQPAKWASVKDDLRKKENWTFYDKLTVLDRHEAP